jgi:signal transduction histidine kinase/CheY-like chemotaxis protein
MWTGLRLARTDPGFSASISELQRDTLQVLVTATGGIILAVYLLGQFIGSTGSILAGTLALGIYALTSILALRLLDRKSTLAMAIWLAGFTTTIILALVYFAAPEIIFLFILLPLLTIVLLSEVAGLVTYGLINLLSWSLTQSWAGSLIPNSYLPVMLIGGAISIVMGWAITHSLLTVASWSLDSYRRAQVDMEEARSQRLELKQIQEDLVHANRELARVSDQLKAMVQVAEDARRVKEQFVANVSHELRTPLNMIIGFSDMILTSPQAYGESLPPALLADITAIQRNSQHLARLVDDVLSLSQIEAGRMALTRDWTDLTEIVNEAVIAVSALYISKKIYLETLISPDLPKVYCDGTRIRQVVLNLLSNAGRFTEKGGVRIRAWQEGEKIIVSVADSGPGISAEDQKRLFEPFQQLDSSIQRRHGGSGLGLSISKNFIEMHGGKMWLASLPGEGTTFYFSLPVNVPSTSRSVGVAAGRWFNPYQQYEVRTREFKVPPPKALPRFVVLEEDDTLTQLICRYLDNCEVVRVHTVEEAISELNHSPARALVINQADSHDLPGLRENFSTLAFRTPILTCWMPGKDQAARRLGVVRYMVKPINREDILSLVESLGDTPKTILLVDDEPEILQLFSRILASASANYRVLQASNGHRALRLLRQRKPDLVLLDLIMPEMDGLQFLEEKNRNPETQAIPVVVISSRDPSGEPIITDTLNITRSDGLSVRDVLQCIQLVSQVLNPSAGSVDPEPREALVDQPASE